MLLRLNPNDNQGLRYPLLGLCLASDSLELAQRLFQDYQEEESAVFAWGRVLERFLANAPEAAKAALVKAREVNKHVLPYFTGRKKMPRRLPSFYGMGDENEAIVCADCLGEAWKKHPGAGQWLIEVTAN